MEFTPITTQEDFDKAISERLKRERETLTKKYADYEELKGKIADYEKQIGEYGRSLNEATEKIKTHDQVVGELQAKVSKYETDSVKTRIAHEMGIPYELAGRLSGDSEEAIRKDAEGLSKIMGTQVHKAPPLKSTEPSGVDSKNVAYKSMLDNMKGE